MFFWCIIWNKVSTWDNIQKRFKKGTRWCSLCKNDEQLIQNLFLKCPFSRVVWLESMRLLKNDKEWEGEVLKEVCKNWWKDSTEGNLHNLPLIISWGIWLAWNRNIFKDQTPSWAHISIECSTIYESIPEPTSLESINREIREEQIKGNIPLDYFDEASDQRNRCGACMVIHLNAQRCLKASVGLGDGSNNYAELQSLKLFLWWLSHLGITSVQISGDSMNVIKWFNGESRCQNYILSPLLEEAKYLKQFFNEITICHIYREHNSEIDQLSKVGVQ